MKPIEGVLAGIGAIGLLCLYIFVFPGVVESAYDINQALGQFLSWFLIVP